MADLLERLLALELEKPETSTVAIPRLGLELTLKELSYRQVAACRREEDQDANFMLAACPTLRDPSWWEERLGCATPIEAIRKVFRPGEVEGVTKEIGKLSGYGVGAVLRPAKKDDKALHDAALGQALEDLEKN